MRVCVCVCVCIACIIIVLYCTECRERERGAPNFKFLTKENAPPIYPSLGREIIKSRFVLYLQLFIPNNVCFQDFRVLIHMFHLGLRIF